MLTLEREAMAGYAEILVHLDDEEASATRCEIAFDMAHRMGSRLIGVYAKANPDSSSGNPWEGGGFEGSPAEASRTAFEACGRGKGVDAEWLAVSSGQVDEVVGHLVMESRCADLTIVGQPARSASASVQDLVQNVIVRSGRSTLVVPFAGTFGKVGERVVIAWNGGREAARAVGDAIPLLKQAQSVIILVIFIRGQGAVEMHNERQTERLVRHLAAHGIETTVERLVVENISLTDSLLSTLADLAADLLVMGAHEAHGMPLLRRETVYQAVLRELTVPLLTAS